ncbi:TPA: hypothetical protein DIC62_03785 [Candidatus Nomurabacteria bacterium]|nr:hypothetical protein [Candidatus Nomurabacteria bacterium]
MSRAKLYQKRGTKVLVNPEDESIEEAEKHKKIGSKKNWLELDRDNFIKHLLKLSDIIDRQISKQTNEAKIYDLSRSKNILQSLVYLILNPIFYREIVKIRKKLKISQCGFQKTNSYKKWAIEYTKKYDLDYKKRELHYAISKKNKVKQCKDILCSFGYNRVFQEAEWIVKTHKIANKRDATTLTTIVASFITRRLKFDSFVQKVAPIIYENNNSFLVGGFDVKVKELPLSHEDFFKYHWIVKLYPFCNKTEIGSVVKDFFERNMIYEKNEKSCDTGWVKFQINNLKINKKEWMQKSELEIKDGKNIVALKFTSDYFSKPSQIVKLYKEKKDEINEMLRKKEEKLKKIQKKHLGRNFARNYFIYKEYMISRDKKTSLQDIYEKIFGEKNDISFDEEKKSFNVVKGELGEFRAYIRDAIKRKIIF